MLGNSSSSGVFVFDLILFVFVVKNLVLRAFSTYRVFRLSTNSIFLVLLVYVFFRTVFALVEDYGYYNNFILYGFYRWCTFGLFLFIVSYKNWNYIEVINVLRRFHKILLIYFFFGTLHQLGFWDLSGYEAMGMDELFFENEEYADFFFRTYLGNVSASVGFIGSLGVFISLFLIRIKVDLKYALLGLFLSSFVLIGSWSRSDLIALMISLLLSVIIGYKKVFGKLVLKTSLTLISIFIVFYSFLSFNDEDHYISENRTFQRFFKTEYTNQLRGDSDGTLAFRVLEQNNALNHIVENIELLLFGYGPNGYRMFMVNGISKMGFGHNIFLHTIGELGLMGGFLLFVFLALLFYDIYQKQKLAPNLIRILCFLTFFILCQRFIAGFAVDTLFAVDNILPMTIIFLFVTIIISRIKYGKV
ncbi:O-antigen ligase family protein [Ulvibacterium sp.]|uniref:O-antigen ligase family protein n=1 Tax=Ulvibacterium sp. TaxID=2665914 RepID=UPI003CC55700